MYPKLYDALGSSVPTSIDFSQADGAKWVLVGFSCGSICVYDKEFTAATVTILQAVAAVLKVQWFPRSKYSFMVLDTTHLVTLWDLKRSSTSAIVSFTLDFPTIQCVDFALPSSAKVSPLVCLSHGSEVTILELSLRS